MFRKILIISTFFLTSCTSFLFVPVSYYPLSPADAEIFYEDIFIEAQDGIKLHGWLLHATDTGETEQAAESILFFHGNGDNVSTQLPNTFWLVQQGYDLTVFDYRGYGQSQGVAELDAIISDMDLMIGYAVSQLPEDKKLIIMGHSLGGAMAIHAVAHSKYRDRIKVLITVEAFSDYHDVTQDVLSKSWLFWLFQWPLSFTIDNSYRPLDAIGLISPVPVLILHSESDEMIDIYHAQRLYDTAREPKTFKLINSSHSKIFITKENRQILLDYLKR